MSYSSIQKKDLEIIQQLGTGSFGIVHLVKKYSDQKLYALKSVKLSVMDLNEKNKALNQVRLLASIRSPYIIKYHGAFFDSSTQNLCILMQFADGGDLSSVIEKFKCDEDLSQGFNQNYIWKIGFQILQGLKILHQNKIVHRDLKSANIFIAQNQYKIGDLNVSKVINKELCSTQTGTPYYTCPQIWKGSQYDEKCDIWSFGCIIYELCTLRYPFVARQLPGLIIKIMKGKYQPISQLYSQQMKLLIKNCLNLLPNDRPSASQLLDHYRFKQLQTLSKTNIQQNQVDLLASFRCPIGLSLLNRKLKKVYTSTRQFSKKKHTIQTTMRTNDEKKMLEDKKTQNVFRISKKKQGKKIKSQKNITAKQQQYQNHKTQQQIPIILTKKSISEIPKKTRNKFQQILITKKINYLKIKSHKKIIFNVTRQNNNFNQ